MAITDLDNVLLLIQRVGDIDPYTGDPIAPLTPGSTGIVMANAERIYHKFSDRLSIPPAAIGAQIFDHYFMITAIQIIVGILESRVDFAAVGTAMRVNLSQRIKARQDQLDRLTKKLEVLEAQSGAYASGAIGLITQIEPIFPPVPGQTSSPTGSPYLDANDPTFHGSPYWPNWRRGY